MVATLMVANMNCNAATQDSIRRSSTNRNNERRKNMKRNILKLACLAVAVLLSACSSEDIVGEGKKVDVSKGITFPVQRGTIPAWNIQWCNACSNATPSG